MKRLAALALLVTACPLSSGTPPLYGCASDDDCAPPLTCRGGVCAGATGGGIATSEDAGAGGTGGGAAGGTEQENPLLDFLTVGTITAARCIAVTLTLSGSTSTHAVTFSATPAGMTLWSDASCTQALGTKQLSLQMTNTTVYVRALTGQVYTLTAQSPTVPLPAAVTVTVLPLVRSGTCTLAVGVGSISCPITPPQENLNETFLAYQASSGAVNDHASVATRCTLASVAQVLCERTGTAGDVAITWQTAEVPGLDAQRLDLACDGSAARTLALQRPIDPARSFVTYGVKQTGAYFSANDAFAATLSDAGVAFSWGAACDENATITAQVVQWPGASVVRGVLGVDAGLATVAALNLAVAQSAFALATWTTSAGIADAPCASMLRVSTPASRTVVVARGDGGACLLPELPRVSYERVELGAFGRVQQVTLAMDVGASSASATVQATDTTRTLVLAGAQTGGQGLAIGEGLLESPSAVPDFAATLRLQGTQLIADRKSARAASRWTVFVVELSP